MVPWEEHREFGYWAGWGGNERWRRATDRDLVCTGSSAQNARFLSVLVQAPIHPSWFNLAIELWALCLPGRCYATGLCPGPTLFFKLAGGPGSVTQW